MMRDIIESVVVLILFPFRILGEGVATLFGLARANDIEWLDGAWADKADVGELQDALAKLREEVPHMRALLASIEAELHPPPPPTLAQRLAHEHGIDCATCEAIIQAAKEAST